MSLTLITPKRKINFMKTLLLNFSQVYANVTYVATAESFVMFFISLPFFLEKMVILFGWETRFWVKWDQEIKITFYRNKS